MLGEITTILSIPLNRILVSIPLSVVGNFSTDAVKKVAKSFNRKNRFQELEETLFDSFLKAIEIHQTRYDKIAQKESAKLRNIVIHKKSSFLLALKSFDPQNKYHIPEQLNELESRKLLAKKIIEVFKEEIPEERKELVEAITRDTLSFYKEAFFKQLSQDNQLSIILQESLQITSIAEVVKEIRRNLPTREEFEIIRSYIISISNKAYTEKDQIQFLKKKYFDYLERKFSSIELTGVSPRVHGQDISFKLKEIFIPFNIETSEIGQRPSAITRRNETYYSSLFPKDEPFIPDKVKLLKNLDQFSQIVLLGDPGGGKTTLLKYITYQMALFQSQDKFLRFYIPIFLRISEYAQVLKRNPSQRLLDFLVNDYDREYSPLYSWAFENCQVLLLLDGLDEVLDVSQRVKVVEEIQDLVARMPENRYIVTSRIIGYDRARLGSQFEHFTIEKFNRSQILAFCQTWYKAVIQTSLQDLGSSQAEAYKLYKAILSKKAIEDLACNPLMITLIANIHFKGQNLPSNRVQLYEIATETLLQYWVQRRITDEAQLKDKDDIIEILSPISYYIHENNPEGLIAEDEFYEQCRLVLGRDEYNLSVKEIQKEIKELIRFLREQSGFFHEKGVDEFTGKSFFGFLHQTFQEYFTAIEIANRWKEGTLEFSELLQNLRWTESLRLATGILNSEKGRSRRRSTTRFVEDIIKVGVPGQETYIRGLLLISLILIDEVDLNPLIQEHFLNLIFEAWNGHYEDRINKEIENHLAFLINSSQRNLVWSKIKSTLENDEFSQIKTRIPQFIIQNCLSIEEAKQIFNTCLLSQNSQISISAWKALKEYIYDIDMKAYHDVQQYGYLMEMDLPISGFEYSDFFEKLELLSDPIFWSILNILNQTLDSYLWLYYSDQYYQGYTQKDLLAEATINRSEKARTLFLHLIEKRNDLLSFEDEIQEILEESYSQRGMASEIREKILQKISELKKRNTA
jgi:GTPase SAR1 family protein